MKKLIFVLVAVAAISAVGVPRFFNKPISCRIPVHADGGDSVTNSVFVASSTNSLQSAQGTNSCTTVYRKRGNCSK